MHVKIVKPILKAHVERSLRISGRSDQLHVAGAAVAFTMNQIAFVYALKATTAVTVSLVFGLFPITVAVLAALLGHEAMTKQKLVAGLLKACEKRPVSAAALEAVADRVEANLQERPEKEIATADIGAFVMEELKKLDKVAYVRFASVYRHFRDIGEFMHELQGLLNPKE